jgi:hypothetical protein
MRQKPRGMCIVPIIADVHRLTHADISDHVPFRNSKLRLILALLMMLQARLLSPSLGGFTMHAMIMGQRYTQVKNTYTVNRDGSMTLHVAQPPLNANPEQLFSGWS